MEILTCSLHCFSYLPQCHSGIMGGGHYVTYAKNPNRKWYCYNDSSCKVRKSTLFIGSFILYCIGSGFQ